MAARLKSMPTGPLSVVIQHLLADAGPVGGGMTSELLARFLSDRDDNALAALVRWGSSPAAPTVKAIDGARARQKSTRSAGSPPEAPRSNRGKPARRSCCGQSASGAAFR
jgi:hypothetical protein